MIFQHCLISVKSMQKKSGKPVFAALEQALDLAVRLGAAVVAHGRDSLAQIGGQLGNLSGGDA